MRAALLGQMLRFGVVGCVGFVVDTLTLYAALALGAGLYVGRALSYVVAASGNWALNRAWTFRTAPRDAAGRQWLLFLAVNLLGFAVNYGTYAALVATVPLAAAHPVLGVAAGSLTGMTGNFLLSRSFVFRPSTEKIEKICG
ncbi:GtrA family protein [Roseomonas sp. E05]|uniref:GtrA family protein n=1 Tax=Roseomonas sp. E05 TaxID=3046310 RepID=UPI0024BA0A02|nr:GtrA family protein [Roseomonas sp. E05]MDJ0387149.1 GtrA family protein [Roseomonas sp. E05]